MTRRTELERPTVQFMPPMIRTLSTFCGSHFQALEKADTQGITEYPDRAKRLHRFYKYSGFDNFEPNRNRFIFVGSCMGVLPPHPKEEERSLVSKLLEIQNEVVPKYRDKYGLKQMPGMPVTTICLRTHKTADQMFELEKYGVKPWGGAISLNSALLWDTFNLQAARWVIDTYGEIGLKAVTFSHLHEGGHQVMEQHRQVVCDERGILDWESAGSFRRPYRKARAPWEFAASELAFQGIEYIQIDNKPVYPDYFVSVSDPRTTNGSYESGANNLRVLTYPNSVYNQPFVVDPHAAKADLEIYKPVYDGKSSWTDWMKSAIESNPLFE